MENLPEDRIAVSNRLEAVVVGVSAGGHEVLKLLLQALPSSFSLAMIIVQHLHPLQDKFFVEYLNGLCALTVREAEEKEPVVPGMVYFAPPNYHLLIERDRTFSLSTDEKVNFSRPSIDVLFESAAEAYGAAVVGVILTGASRDGAAGLRRIWECGGPALVQDPGTAQFPAMPLAAIEVAKDSRILKVEEIGALLAQMGQTRKRTGP